MLKNLDYGARLTAIDITTLRTRRDRGDLIQMFIFTTEVGNHVFFSMSISTSMIKLKKKNISISMIMIITILKIFEYDYEYTLSTK